MLRKIVFLLLAILIGLPFKTIGQQPTDRYATWIHGYNGNETTWNNFRNDFNLSYQINAQPAYLYNSTVGMKRFALAVVEMNYNAMHPINNDHRHITIAHSFGGAVARHIDLSNDPLIHRNLGGLITVGSPLSGAGIATAINNGTAHAEAENGVSQMERGPRAYFQTLFAFIPGAANAIARLVGLGISEIINSLVHNKIIDGTKPDASTEDLAYGSANMKEDMDKAPTSLPKISIYGNEESPIHFNYIASLTGKDIVGIADEVEDAYYTYYVTSNVAGIGFTIAGIFSAFNPYLFTAASLYFWQANEWHAGYIWLNNSERLYTVLIGANISNNQCFQVQAYTCYYPSSSSSCWQTRTYCVNAQLNGQSDGFIPANSQAGFGSRSWEGVPLVEAIGVNHYEEHDANNATMQGIFRDIFAGNKVPYFQTDIR